MVHYLGAHINPLDDLINETDKVKKAGGNMVQIFLTLPGEKVAMKQTQDDLKNYKDYLDKNGMKVVVHSSYTHNMAREWDKYSWWIKNLEIEIKYAHYIGAIGLVLHFGKSLELTKEEAYNNMYTSLIYIHNKTIQYKDVPILLETSTGQGTELCFKIEDLAHFYKKFSKNITDIKDRFKLCIDTCHVFSAGYDIRTKKGVTEYLKLFEKLIGLRYVRLIHLNDCKVELGKHVDRHENFGKGFIGLDGIKIIYKYFKKINIPIILETPNEGYNNEFKMLLC